MRRRRTLLWLAAILLAAATALVTLPYVEAARSLATVTGQPGWAQRFVPSIGAVSYEDVVVPTREGDVAARVYRPPGRAPRTLVVFPGVHAGGVEEPRLAELSARLAATGAVVVSTPLPELRRYVVTSRSTDTIEDVTGWVAREPALAPAGVVGLIGVSFAGGLAIVAAGRPSIADRISVVLSIGGYGDLRRVLRYLCTGVTPAGTVRRPHDYGVAVVLHGAADRLVPEDQVAGLQQVIQTLLDAGSAQAADPARARRLFEAAARQAAALPHPAGELAELALARDVEAVGARLLPHVEAIGGAPELSPERSPPPSAAVFLLHGADDALIPAGEVPRLASDLRARGAAEVTAHVTALLAHAEMESTSAPADAWALVRFWKALLAAS
jgi:dienelactone hydrolase